MPNRVPDDQPPRAQVRRVKTAGMGYRLAAGGLASRRAGLARPVVEALPEEDAWEPILPEAWSQSRAVRWILATARQRSLRPSPHLRWSWLKSETVYQAAFLSTASAMVLTLMLYWGKSHAALIDGEIGRAMHQTQDARQHTYMLRAEWASLNDPGRLKPMVDRYLAMKRIDPSQFVAPEQLPDRLDHPPPPVAVQPEITPEPDATVADVQDDKVESVLSPEEAPAVIAAVPVVAKASGAAKPRNSAAPQIRVAEASVARTVVPTVSANPRIYRVAARVAAQVTGPQHTASLTAARVLPARPAPYVTPAYATPATATPATATPATATSYRPQVMRTAFRNAAAMPAPRPELPRWLTQTPIRMIRAAARPMSLPPHMLGVPAAMSAPFAVEQHAAQEPVTHHYLTTAAQLPALRRPAEISASLPRVYGGSSPGVSYSSPVSHQTTGDDVAARYEPPPYMGAVGGDTSSD